MKIWLIQIGEPLPVDPGEPRLFRTGLLAKYLSSQGRDVTWWASTFQHSKKKHRYHENKIIQLEKNYRLILLHSPGYQKNISIKRIRDHQIIAKEFRKMASGEQPPTIIHCGYPTIELSLEACLYGKQNNVPVVLDARDMWPDIYSEVFPKPLRWLGDLLTGKMRAKAKEAFGLATSISGHAPAFVDFGLRYAGRSPRSIDNWFPFGYFDNPPTKDGLEKAASFWDLHQLGDQSTTPVVCFFGAFGRATAVDLKTPVMAAEMLEKRGVKFKLVMCGLGTNYEKIKSMSSKIESVMVPGWVGYPEIWMLMRRSRLGLLPYLPTKDYSLSVPNKAVEYLSAGLPILTSLTHGYLHEILKANECGLFYESADPTALADVIENVLKDEHLLKAMSENATRLFETNYKPEKIYRNMSEHLEKVVQWHKANGLNPDSAHNN